MMKPICLAFASTIFLVFSLTNFPSVVADEPKDTVQNTNRLAEESSPYLLLHAHNPVDWFPWGPEAFEKAKTEGKVIFLSIGYSSCYWCHVMERNVFSDEEIAQYMNDHFVNIKVDREERPDVDDIYMTSLIVYQQMAGSPSRGGWPLSMFLTPDGNPIAGATYLPPTDSPTQGRGFPSVARHVDELWKTRKDDIQQSAMLIAEQVQRITKPSLELQQVSLSAILLDGAIAQVKELYDPVWGGVDFDSLKPQSPRFPNVPRLEMALDLYESSGDEDLRKIVEHSLTQMAKGGIRDHLAGGFHRYSTDRQWHVPHFEKMLYDQAMLLGVYSRTFEISKNPTYAGVASEIAEFVLREMTNNDGAFCSAFDAETNAIEGEYYVWKQEEITRTLGEQDAVVFSKVYSLDRPNPFEHGYVLHQTATLSEHAADLNLTVEELDSRLANMRMKLLQLRSERKSPLLDDKVLTAWNAMMIRALAVSGRVLDREQDIVAAERAAEFLLNNLREDNGHLLRTWRNGVARYSAYLDDYAFLVSAFLELHKATGKDRWKSEATELAKLQNSLFYDETLQAFFYTANDHEKLIARTSSAYDSVFPSGNSLSVRNLIALNSLAPTPEFESIARSTLTRFAPTLQRSPASCSGLASALNDWLTQEQPVSDSQSEFIPVRETGGRYQLVRFGDETTNRKQAESPATNQDSPEIVLHSTFRPVSPPQAADNGFAQEDKPKPLKVKIYPMYNKLPQKGKCLVAIELQVKLGWHINANPSNPDFLVPTKVELKSNQKVKLTKIKYPKHHELKVDGSDEPYHVYDGKTIVYGLLEIDETEVTDFAELEFHVAFQGCNSTQCLPPDLVVMKGKLPIAAAGEELKKTHEDKFPKPEPPAKDSVEPKPANPG